MDPFQVAYSHVYPGFMESRYMFIRTNIFVSISRGDNDRREMIHQKWRSGLLTTTLFKNFLSAQNFWMIIFNQHRV